MFMVKQLNNYAGSTRKREHPNSARTYLSLRTKRQRSEAIAKSGMVSLHYAALAIAIQNLGLRQLFLRKIAFWITFFHKLKGDNTELPAKHSTRSIILAWLGGFLAISAVALLSNTFSATLVLGSFGASCVLVFGFPDAPFSQPRNVLVGHFLSSFIGLVCLTLFGATWWSVAIAVSTAISVMMLTRTTHPPAGSNPVIIYLTKPAWSFLLFPTVFGAIVLIFVALLYNNFIRESKYPKYW
jgi:CBS-domain-containing membrane protein